MKINKRKGTKKLFLRRIFILAYLAWMLVSAIFFLKALGISLEILAKKNMYDFVKSYNSDIEVVNYYYNDYKSYNNDLINSKDRMISFFAKQKGETKFLLLLGSLVPFGIICYEYEVFKAKEIRRKAKVSRQRVRA